MAASSASTSRLSEANIGRWAAGGFVGSYANRSLRPAEVLLLVRFREQFSGRVLELGCGAGRFTGYLTALAETVCAVDVSPDMIAESRRRYPNAEYKLRDAGDLSAFDDAAFDLVLAADNLIDVFSDQERRRLVRDIRRVLAPEGLLVLSTHNRAYVPRLRRPWHVRLGNLRHPEARGILQVAADLARLPVRVRNYLRTRRLHVSTPGYALVGDAAHNFSFVHYYIDHDAQLRQFEEAGLEPVLSLDRDGNVLSRSDPAPGSPEIHYVARRPASG